MEERKAENEWKQRVLRDFKEDRKKRIEPTDTPAGADEMVITDQDGASKNESL